MRAKVALTLVVLAVSAAAEQNWDAAGKAWWSHVQFLADDKLEGRNVGSAGYDMAANYVVNQFKRAGLKPGNDTDYSQIVEFKQVNLDEAGSRVSLNDGPIKLGDEALITSTSNAVVTNAPMVFVGYGLDIPEAGYSDLKVPGLQGAVAVYLTGGPANISAELRSHHSSGAERAAAMRAAGIVGTIAIPNPKSMDIPWQRQSANRLLPRMALAEAPRAVEIAMPFSATWNPAKADRLFQGSGHTIAEILDAADHDRPLPHFALKMELGARVTTTIQKVISRNIIGIIPGTDVSVKNEYVILSAHLDHLGVGEKVNGDGIFNGAMDDASGIASLIEIARSLKEQKTKTRRSVLFLAVTGEEKGELGSKYFAEYPTVEGRIVADINMDMYLPLFPLRYLEVQGLNESSLGDDIRAVAKAAGVEVQADKDPNANRFIRSDQYSFIRKGIPALAFKFGWIPGSPEERIYRDWYRDRYHAVGDDASQPVDAAAAAHFNAILAVLLERVANAPAAPAWKPDSFFRRFAKP
jgi:hypothetical protein